MTYQFESNFENETNNYRYLNNLSINICHHLFNQDLSVGLKTANVINTNFRLNKDIKHFRVIIDYPSEHLTLSYGFCYNDNNIPLLENCHIVGIPQSLLNNFLFFDEMPARMVINFDLNHNISSYNVNYSVKVHHAHIDNYHWEHVVYLSKWTDFEFVFDIYNNTTNFVLVYNQTERDKDPQTGTFSISNMDSTQFHYVFGLFKILENIDQKNIINELFPYLTVSNIRTIDTFKEVFNKYLHNESYSMLIDKFTLLAMDEI